MRAPFWNRIRHLSEVNEISAIDKNRDKFIKNYLFLYTTISAELEVLLGQTKMHFKEQRSTFPTIFYSSTGSHYSWSYSDLKIS